MDSNPYTVERLVTELREARTSASSEDELLGRVRAIAQRAAACHRAWLRDEMCRPDAEQGFGFHLLHEEAGHGLPLFIGSAAGTGHAPLTTYLGPCSWD